MRGQSQQTNNRRHRRHIRIKRLTSDMRARLMFIFVFLIVLLLVVNGRLTYLNIAKKDAYEIQVLNQQQYSSKTLPYKRGDILDRNGNLLATSVKVYNLILDPKIILSNKNYKKPTLAALTSCFKDLKKEELQTILDEKKTSSYVVLKKKLSYEDIKAFLDIQNNTKENPNVKGVWFETEYQRSYPYSTLACSVIGFANSSNVASLGIEGYYSDELNGINGREYGYLDDSNNMEKVTKNPTDGNTVISTIDMKIQSTVEKKIASYQKQIKAKSISVVIANPNNGEILAMAGDKTFDLNSPTDLTGYYSKSAIAKMTEKQKSDALNEIWKNAIVTDAFEPGSTMKPFTISMALEENLVNENDTYVCDGKETVGKTTIDCNGVHGTVTLKQAIAISCNDALMQVGAKIGKDKFCQYQRNFGFGSKTGIDLPQEAAGMLYSESSMSNVDLATNAFGQNFTLNMIQMTAGFSSLVNGGKYYTPHVVKQVKNSKGGLVRNVEANEVKQTITEDTSEFIKDGLRMVVTEGTGSKAAIKGYDIGGKTGTAEKLPRGNNEYMLSFIGCVPCKKPEVVCYVVIDTPKENPSDSEYATQLFQNIMKEVLPYMNIYKSGS